jgi:hypothetical protein
MLSRWSGAGNAIRDAGLALCGVAALVVLLHVSAWVRVALGGIGIVLLGIGCVLIYVRRPGSKIES